MADLYNDDFNECFKKTFVCDVCNKIMTTMSNLRQHQLIHIADRRFVCDMCKRRFIRADHLAQHIRIIHANEQPFACDFCDKRFTTSSNLRQHKLVHSSIKPFVCVTCDKRFTVANVLRRHELIHTGEKPFVCRFCGKGFNQNSTMRTHEQTQHVVKWLNLSTESVNDIDNILLDAHRSGCGICGEMFTTVDAAKSCFYKHETTTRGETVSHEHIDNYGEVSKNSRLASVANEGTDHLMKSLPHNEVL